MAEPSFLNLDERFSDGQKCPVGTLCDLYNRRMRGFVGPRLGQQRLPQVLMSSALRCRLASVPERGDWGFSLRTVYSGPTIWKLGAGN